MQGTNSAGMVWGSLRREDERVRKDGRMLGPYIGPGESTYTKHDTAVTGKAADWLRDAAGKGARCCLCAGLVAPHFPLIVPQEYLDMYPPESLPEFKLHTTDGIRNHPWVDKWVDKQNEALLGEDGFESEAGRRLAASCCFALCTLLDDSIGKIMQGLEDSGQLGDTTLIYTSDHGDNVGARGLWGKSNMYEESVAAPLIVAEPGHVGDGNVHLVVLVDPERPAEMDAARDLAATITKIALSFGGTASGEHGVGLGKRSFMGAEHGAAYALMRRLKTAVDPDDIMTPGKLV